MYAETLHPNLRRYWDGSWLRHPLVVMHSPVPKEANYFYNLKKSEIAVAIREQDWEDYVALHERRSLAPQCRTRPIRSPAKAERMVPRAFSARS
jgi:hypothetical protein